MSNKIDNSGLRPLDISGGTRRSEGITRGDRAATSGSNEASTGDTVNLTRSALLLQKLEEALANAPVVDVARVGAIRDAITSGAYQIDAAAIADSIMQSNRELS